MVKGAQISNSTTGMGALVGWGESIPRKLGGAGNREETSQILFMVLGLTAITLHSKAVPLGFSETVVIFIFQ